jgi:hypothetical protein
VEGSVITIAACIPLLQPLIEAARHHPWSRLGTRQGTSTGPDSRKGDVSTTQADRLRAQRTRRKLDMDSLMETNNHDETIVAPEPAGLQSRYLDEHEIALVPITGKPQSGSNSTPPMPYQGIYRTDDIHISYSRDETGRAKQNHYQSDWA